MKVLIADDEKHVREAIDLLVDWNRWGITEKFMAEDGKAALHILKTQRPDILFVDMHMPLMNGMELLHALRKEEWDCQVIVVSGHNDFQFMRAAIQANVLDYIMKPVSVHDINQALERAIGLIRKSDEVQQEEREEQFLIKTAGTLLNEQGLAAYLKGEVPNSQKIARLLHAHQFTLSDKVLISVFFPKNRLDIIEKRFAGDALLFHFAVTNISSDCLHNKVSYMLCHWDDYQWIVIVKLSQTNFLYGDIAYFSRKLAEAWKRTIGLEVMIGTCSKELPLSECSRAIAEAQGALLHGFVFAANNGCRHSKKQELPQLIHSQFDILKAIESGNKEQIQFIVRQFVDLLMKMGGITLRDLQMYTMEANVLLVRCRRLFNLPQPNAMDATQMIMPWIADLLEWESLFVHLLWNVMENADCELVSSEAIEEIKYYLDGHFHKDISLNELSKLFYLSPQYISKRFKEVYKTNIISYLTDLRMEKAKVLLTNSRRTVSEIAYSLGYDDQNYFGKVFKKSIGVSPKNYKILLQNN